MVVVAVREDELRRLLSRGHASKKKFRFGAREVT